MFNLPKEIIRKIYSFDPTYRNIFKKSLKQIKKIRDWKNFIFINCFNIDILECVIKWKNTDCINNDHIIFIKIIDNKVIGECVNCGCKQILV